MEKPPTLLGSAIAFLRGVLRRWYFWAFAILGDPFEVYAKWIRPLLPGWDWLPMEWVVPPMIGFVALILLLGWAALCTYHELRRETHRLSRSEHWINARLYDSVCSLVQWCKLYAQSGKRAGYRYNMRILFDLCRQTLEHPPRFPDDPPEPNSNEQIIAEIDKVHREIDLVWKEGIRAGWDSDMWEVERWRADLNRLRELGSFEIKGEDRSRDHSSLYYWMHEVLQHSRRFPKRYIKKMVAVTECAESEQHRMTGDPQNDAARVNLVVRRLIGIADDIEYHATKSLYSKLSAMTR